LMVDRAGDYPRRSKFSPCSEGPARCRAAPASPSVRPKRTPSGRRNYDLGARRNPDLAPALQPVCKPNSASEGDERAEHNKAEGAGEMAENGAEGMAEKIPGGDEARCAYPGREKIQTQESLPANRAHPHRE